MKRFLSFVASFILSVTCLLLLGGASVANAQRDKYGDLTYELINGEIEIKACYYKVTDVVIPDMIDGYPVTAIGEGAFERCEMKSIVIPDSVRRIEAAAFLGCYNLEGITIPKGVTEIGNFAFEGCGSLVSITIPDGITKIGDHMFTGCRSLSDVNIPSGVVSIGSAAFSGCTSLTQIPLPDGVTVIENDAFENCTGITSLVIPDGVTRIGDGAFEGCSALTSIKLSNNLVSLYNYVFSGCTSLASVTLPESLEYINRNTFFRCTSLIEVVLPEKVKYIGPYAFEDCTGLSRVELRGKADIHEGAFKDCSALESVTVKGEITRIRDEAFVGCGKLSEITVSCTTAVSDKGNDVVHIDHVMDLDRPALSKTPTCAEDGIRTIYCLCGKTNYTKPIPRTGEHTYGQAEVIAEPTERQDGLARRRCAKCDATIDEVIPRLAGDGVGVWGVVLITSVSVVVLGVAVLLIIFIKKKKNSK